MNEAEALLFVPGYFVLGRSDINTNPICLDQVKNNQWDVTKVFSPIYGHTADIMEDVVYGKVKKMSVLLWQKYRVQIKLFEYHGIRDSRLVSKRQATPYLIVHLEKRKYRGDPVVGFITQTVREFLVESNLHEVHCLVMEDECWDHAGDGYNNTDADEDMIDEMWEDPVCSHGSRIRRSGYQSRSAWDFEFSH